MVKGKGREDDLVLVASGERKGLEGFLKKEGEVVCSDEYLLPDDDKGLGAIKVWLLIVHIFLHLAGKF